MKIKTLFKKQILFYMSIVVGITVILAAVISVVYKNDYVSRKEEILIMHGSNISNEYSALYGLGIIDYDSIQKEILELHKTEGADVFIIGADGTVYIASSGIGNDWMGETIKNKVVSEILKGNIVTVKDENLNMFAEPVLAVGYPIVLGGDVSGGILMCVSMPEIENAVKDVYFTAIKFMVIAAAAGVILVYVFTRKMTKPLVEMNEAAKIIAGGNFDKRVMVCGEDEIGQLGKSFNNMAESLEKQENQRRDFIANVSHDLRSPLTSIKGYIKAMLDGTIPIESRDKYLNIVMEEAERLSKITNDVVSLSSAQSSVLNLNIEKFDINEVIRETIKSFEKIILDKELYMKLILAQEKTFVSADRDKIQRVLYNLIDNAVKFTENEGEIMIEVSLSENEKVIVSVEDTGIGISKEERKYVFDRFYKTDLSRGLDKKSGGLGLSIAKEFIMAHGESIGIAEKEGKGTKILFTLKKAEE